MWDLLNDLDLISFLDEIDINYETTGPNIGTGWVGLDTCPFEGCGNFHFGIAIANKQINCWICGVTGTIIKFLMKHFNISKDDAFFMIKEHLEEAELTQDTDIETLVHKTFSKNVKKVEEDRPMEKIDRIPGKPITEEMVRERTKLRAFLKERMITVQLCIWHKFRYDYERSLRLIMPIFNHKGDTVAFQGRDVTGKAMLPYITQPKGVDLGSTMFNIDNYDKQECIIIVEGILDAVRIENVNIGNRGWTFENICIMACFTSSPTVEQLLLIPKVEKVLVMLDNDSWINHKKFRDLPMDIEPIILPPGSDPGSLTDLQFDELNLSQYLP